MSELTRAIGRCVEHTAESAGTIITPPEDLEYPAWTGGTYEEELAYLLHKPNRTSREQDELEWLWEESERVLGIGE